MDERLRQVAYDIGILTDITQSKAQIIQHIIGIFDGFELGKIHQPRRADRVHKGSGHIVDTDLNCDKIRLTDPFADLRAHLEKLFGTLRMTFSIPVFSLLISVFQLHSLFQQIPVVTDSCTGTGRRINSGLTVLLQDSGYQIRK